MAPSTSVIVVKEMKTYILFVLLAATVKCAAFEHKLPPSEVTLGKDERGVFISTNATSVRFYFIITNTPLSAMIGSKLDTNVISIYRMEVMRDRLTPMERVNGNLVFTNAYDLLQGRYAELNGQILTLSDFKMHVSASGDRTGEVLTVYLESSSFPVSPAFAADVKKYRSEKLPSEK